MKLNFWQWLGIIVFIIALIFIIRRETAAPPASPSTVPSMPPAPAP
jgi:hypothetical protein